MKFINRKFVWLILSLIVISIQANAQEKVFDDSVLSDKGRGAYKSLLKTEFSELDGIVTAVNLQKDVRLNRLFWQRKSQTQF